MIYVPIWADIDGYWGPVSYAATTITYVRMLG